MNELAFASRGIINGTARCANTGRSLTHLLDVGERGLAVKATRDKIALLLEGRKRCSGPCGAIRSLDDFYVEKRGLGGRRSRCKDCWSLAGRDRYTADLEAAREAGRETARRYRENYPEKARRVVDEYQARMRATVLDHYGRSCACCGETENLAVDHVKGDGGAHRAEIGGGADTLDRWLIANVFPEGFQVLCRRCNSSKANGKRCRINHDLDGVLPEEPVVRYCAACGDFIDPIHYCPDCMSPDRLCMVHRRPRKRADATVCSKKCQNALRFIACDIPEIPAEPREDENDA